MKSSHEMLSLSHKPSRYMSNIHNYKEFNPVLSLFNFRKVDSRNLFHIYRLETCDKSKKIVTPSFRQFFYDISLFQIAKMKYSYSFLDHDLCDSMLQVVPPRQVQKIEVDQEELENVKGYTIYFKPEFLSMAFDKPSFIADFPFFSYSNLDNLIQLNQTDLRELLGLMERIMYTYEQDDLFADQLINGYLWSLLHLIKRIWIRYKLDENNDTISKVTQLVSSFEDVVNSNIKASLKVSDIADELCISPEHFSQIISSQTGQNPKAYIQNTLISEIKSLLKHTRLSISDISYSLEFSDVSKFGRFFKSHTSMSPTEFREYSSTE